jgi:hypothetical protein
MDYSHETPEQTVRRLVVELRNEEIRAAQLTRELERLRQHYISSEIESSLLAGIAKVLEENRALDQARAILRDPCRGKLRRLRSLLLPPTAAR